VNAFAFEDDYRMGVLLSRIHHEWARGQASTLRVDIRYTPTSSFETFPWPLARKSDIEDVADLARAIVALRGQICTEHEIGLTRLYNQADDGAYRPLQDLHRGLDEAVAAAYGWPASAAHDSADSNRLLLELNRAIVAGEVAYEPFGPV